MKTAISIDDETFRRVDEAAVALGTSRSEFFARAAKLYLAELDSTALRHRIDTVLTRVSPDDDSLGAFNLRRIDELTEGDEW